MPPIPELNPKSYFPKLFKNKLNYIIFFLVFFNVDKGNKTMIMFFYILWKKSRLKLTFLPYHVKKNHSTLELDTFKVMLLLSYLAHDFKSPLLDIEITISV